MNEESSVTPRPAPQELLPWALSVLGETLPAALPALSPVAGDASARRYFRFTRRGCSYIAVDSPPASQKNAEFLRVAKLLAAAGVTVPELFGADLELGFMLLEDLGDRTLLPVLDIASVHGHYRRAFDVLEKMAVVPSENIGLGSYDRALLSEELSRFTEWFVQGLLHHELVATEMALIDALSTRLIDSALQQPRVLVHRDFHSRNLMLVGQDGLAVIDFQDAVVGPITYDLVSLLRDCYIQWPASSVLAWALAYRDRLRARGLLAAVDEVQFMRWFDWMGLQRHLKVLGTFARLYLRDGKAGYLADLPLVIHYVMETLDKYAPQEPLFAEFGAWFHQRLQPLVAQQAWSAAR
jgi:aminoglycoside/choline kinase family phosphotransferase